jgi:MFS family permease
MNEEETRDCTEISAEACACVPKNFFLIIISGTLTKLGDAISNPKTVLVWLMGYVGAPLAMIGFLVPIRESGSMLPQIFIAGFIRKLPIRKWVWVWGSLLQFVAITGIGIVALYFEGNTAGWLILLLLILFSLSRGLSSVASKDVLGKTIPKLRRGRLNGYSTAVSGFLVIAVGIFMLLKPGEETGIRFYAYLIFFAGLLWFLGAVVYSKVKEYPGESSVGGKVFREALSRLSLLKNDKPFRNFVITRSLLLCSALTAPYYVVLAQEYLGKDLYILGLFIVANGIASSISAPFWGRWADMSSRKVMVRAAMIAAVLGILMFVVVAWIPGMNQFFWLYPLAFFILGVAHSGVRLGRKTYIVDMAGGNKRTDYVSVSNTIIGLVLLITGGISALASFIPPEGIILILSLFGLAGAYTGHRLPEVE